VQATVSTGDGTTPCFRSRLGVEMSDFTKLVRQCQDKHPANRKKAILKLSKLDDSNVVEPILELVFDSDVSVSYFARKALKSLRYRFKSKDASFDKRMCDLYLKKNFQFLRSLDSRKQIGAIQRLAKLTDPRIFKVFSSLLEVEKKPRVVATLVKALAAVGGSRALKHVEPFLASSEPRIRANAIEAITVIPVSGKFELLSPYLYDESPRVRANVAQSLWYHSRIKVIDVLRTMLRSEDSREAKSAIFALSTVGTPEARDLLLNIAGTPDLDEEVQKALAQVEQKIERALKEAGETDQAKLHKPELRKPVKILSFDETVAAARKLLSSKQYQERLEGVCQLADLNTREVLPDLLKLLEDEDSPYVLSALTKGIGKIGGPEVGSRLKPYLKHSDSRVRANTVEGLSYLADKRNVDLFLWLIADPEPRVAAEAARAIAERHPDEARGKLLEMTSSTEVYKVQSAIYALGEIGESYCEEILASLLTSPVEAVKLSAENALNKMAASQQSRSEVLIDTITEDKVIDESALGEALASLSSKDRIQKQRAIDTICQLGTPEQLPVLFKALKKEPDPVTKASLVKTVGALGDESVVPRLKPYLEDQDSRIRANTVEALGHFKTPEAVELILPRLYDDDGRVKANAIKFLWEVDRDRAKLEIESMIESPEAWKRLSAIHILGNIGDYSALNLLKRLTSDGEVDIVLQAYNMINKIYHNQDNQVRSVLELYQGDISEFEEAFILENQELLIRSQIELLRRDELPAMDMAMKNLKKLVTLENLDYFTELLSREGNRYVRATLLSVIGSLRVPEIIPVVRTYLKDTDHRVRANAVAALFPFSDKDIFDLLSPLLCDPDQRVKINAVVALQEHFEIELLDQLEKMLDPVGVSKDTRETMRKEAVFCLITMGTEESIHLLEEEAERAEQEIRRSFQVESIQKAAAVARTGKTAALQGVSRWPKAPKGGLTGLAAEMFQGGTRQYVLPLVLLGLFLLVLVVPSRQPVEQPDYGPDREITISRKTETKQGLKDIEIDDTAIDFRDLPAIKTKYRDMAAVFNKREGKTFIGHFDSSYRDHKFSYFAIEKAFNKLFSFHGDESMKISDVHVVFYDNYAKAVYKVSYYRGEGEGAVLLVPDIFPLECTDKLKKINGQWRIVSSDNILGFKALYSSLSRR